MNQQWDIVIVGGGAAGLSAALMLGRCRRSVLVCDSSSQRNLVAEKMYGFLTRDGVSPEDFLSLARRDLKSYPSVVLAGVQVVDVIPVAEHFYVKLQGAVSVRARKLLLATGIVDELPAIPGIDTFFGTSVFACPYCHGWETRNSSIAVYGKGEKAFEMARALTAWSRDIVLLTNGDGNLTETQREMLRKNGVLLDDRPIQKLSGHEGKLSAIEFVEGPPLSRAALFFDTESNQRSPLAKKLGCVFTKNGGLKTDDDQCTSIPGIYCAGDVSKETNFAIVAAAEGARAAVGINKALTREDFDCQAGITDSGFTFATSSG
jgi:thioredoxin reductase